MKSLLLSNLLLLGLTAPALAQTSEMIRTQYYRLQPVRPDAGLTRQAFRLSQHFTQPAWTGFAAQLGSLPQPVESYLGFTSDEPLYSTLRYLGGKPRYWRQYTTPEQLLARQRELATGPFGQHYGLGQGFQLSQPVSWHATNQFYRHLWAVQLERRQTDYERIESILQARHVKVTKLKQALPVLLFKLDSTGRVEGVDADPLRTTYGLTARSRKLIIKALSAERFHALEARNIFNKPHPWQERLARLSMGRRFSTAGHFLIGWLPVKRKPYEDKCGPISNTLKK
ncbi:MAG: hypothetical protein ACRYF0_19675 [Janthinobacterium lividum]